MPRREADEWTHENTETGGKDTVSFGMSMFSYFQISGTLIKNRGEKNKLQVYALMWMIISMALNKPQV